MPISLDALFYCWSLTLTLACSWDLLCGFTGYDLRNSAGDCLRLKQNSGSCVPLAHDWCATPAGVMVASPRWLSSFAGNFGPLIMWAPLLLAAPTEVAGC